MHKPLAPTFFDRPTTEVAKDLLGKFLIREYEGYHWTLMVTEVEAYDGPEDKASHAHKGRTQRTEPMFAHAGIFYVYLVYGMHWMLNVVTGPKGYPAAILIRSALIMLPTGAIEHVDGPAKLTKFIKINKEFNALKAIEQNGLWFEDRGISFSKEQIVQKKRIGVEYAAEWKDAPYNFSVEVLRNTDLKN